MQDICNRYAHYNDEQERHYNSHDPVPFGWHRIAKPKLVAKIFHFFSAFMSPHILRLSPLGPQAYWKHRTECPRRPCVKSIMAAMKNTGRTWAIAAFRPHLTTVERLRFGELLRERPAKSIPVLPAARAG
jgi:hypothetical protein